MQRGARDCPLIARMSSLCSLPLATRQSFEFPARGIGNNGRRRIVRRPWRSRWRSCDFCPRFGRSTVWTNRRYRKSIITGLKSQGLRLFFASSSSHSPRTSWSLSRSFPITSFNRRFLSARAASLVPFYRSTHSSSSSPSSTVESNPLFHFFPLDPFWNSINGRRKFNHFITNVHLFSIFFSPFRSLNFAFFRRILFPRDESSFAKFRNRWRKKKKKKESLFLLL